MENTILKYCMEFLYSLINSEINLNSHMKGIWNQYVYIADFAAFEMRKKLDPLKTLISQPLRSADYLGPSGCEIKVFNGPIFKSNSMVPMSSCLRLS
jgi:hypothetical protein